MAKRRSSRARTVEPGRLRLVVGFVVLLILVIGVILMLSDRAPDTAAVDPTAPGRLVADRTTVDLGRVAFDYLAEAHFELTNTGSDTVRLVGAPRVRMLEGC